MPDPFYAGQPDYLVKLNELFNLVQNASPQVTNYGTIAPLNGSWSKDQFVKNSNVQILGIAPNQYVVNGWLCVQSGTPGVWVEIRYPISQTMTTGTGSSTAPAPTPAPTPAPSAFPWETGANIHIGGETFNEGAGAIATNTSIATIFNARRFKRARMDLYGGDHTNIRDQITKLNAYGVQVQCIVYPPGFDSYVARTNLTTAYNDGYNGTYTIVNAMCDLASDFELLNEVQYRPEILAEVTPNSVQGNVSAYLNHTACEGMAAFMKGMAQAIRDVAAATGRTLRIINGLATRDYAWIDFLNQRSVKWDVLGFHFYPSRLQTSFNTDTWYYAGGAAAMLARFGKPVTINEYNAGEIYDGSYENTDGANLTEQGYTSITTHFKEILASVVNLESVIFYELVDQPTHTAPEKNFGMMRNLSTPKPALYVATAFAGGTLSGSEITALTSRSLFTSGEITSYQRSAPPAPPPAPAYTARVQAESMTNAVLKTDIPGYDGSGFADQQTVASAPTFIATFTIPTTGTYDINIRYFTYGPQLNYVQVDSGTLLEQSYQKTYPGWQVLTVPSVSLTAGSHQIKLVYEWGYTYYDYVEVVTHVAAPPPPAPAPTPSPPAPPPGSAPFRPFGSRPDGAYPYGVHPTQTNAAMDAAVKSLYDQWKGARLKTAPTFTAQYGIYTNQVITGAYYVDTNNLYVVQPTWDAAGNPIGGVRAGTVSEAMGYGMLITVIMAGYDANAKVYFDGLFKLVRARPAYGMTYWPGSGAETYLMDWRLGLDMSSQGGGWGAQDGDMDIALALLMAHRQWGSTGTINYWQEAKNAIQALKLSGFDPTTGIMYVGGGKDISRTSDMMPGHFRCFNAATGDTFWNNSRTNSYTLVNSVINTYSPTAKLPPGWIWQPLTPNAQPSPGGRIESSIEGIYDGNAVRDPWRWGADYVWSGDSNWGTLASQITATIKGSASGSPNNLSYAYLLNGTPYSNLYYDPGIAALTAVGGMFSSAHQAWIDACWNRIVGASGYNVNYYVAELTLIPMIVLSGNWWRAL